MQAGFHNHEFEFNMLEGQLIYDALMARFDPDLVKMQFQTEVINLGYKAADYFKKYPGRFISSHLSDWTTDKKEVPIGQGVIDWKEFFAAAKTGGVKYFFVEMAPTKAWFSTFGYEGLPMIKNLTQFYIEPGDLKLFATKNNFKTLKLIGSASDDRIRLEKLEEPVNNQIYSVNESYRHYDDEYRIGKAKNSDSSRLKILSQMKDSTWALLDELYRKKAQIDSVFIIENPNSMWQQIC